MRRRRVDDFRRISLKLVGNRDGFFRSRVGKAQHDEIDVAHHLGARPPVLAQCRIDALHIDGAHASQPLADFEAGRPSLAVDEDLGLAGVLRRPRRHISPSIRADA